MAAKFPIGDLSRVQAGDRVTVHQNLSLQRSRPDLGAVWVICGKGGERLAYCHDVTLLDVTFEVSESSRQRVVRNRCREVHAWCLGRIAAVAPQGEAVPVTYNPFRAATFVRRDDGHAVTQAHAVRFTRDGAVAIDPTA